MATNTTPARILVLRNVRLSYPHLWTPQEPKGKGKAKYGATFLIKPDAPEIAAIKAEMARVAKDKFGDNWQAIVKAMEASKQCLRNGVHALDKNGVVQSGYAGMMYLVAKNHRKVTVIDRNKTPLTENDGKPYGGCFVNATVEIYAMKAKGDISNCIAATLNAVQFFAPGEAFGAGPTSAEGLDELEDDETDTAAAGDDPFA